MKPEESFEAEFQRIDREMKQLEQIVICALVIFTLAGATAWWVLR